MAAAAVAMAVVLTTAKSMLFPFSRHADSIAYDSYSPQGIK